MKRILCLIALMVAITCALVSCTLIFHTPETPSDKPLDNTPTVNEYTVSLDLNGGNGGDYFF